MGNSTEDKYSKRKKAIQQQIKEIKTKNTQKFNFQGKKNFFHSRNQRPRV
jgi:hypothetical protein